MMGFLRQAYESVPESPITITSEHHVKRKRMSAKVALLKGHKHAQTRRDRNRDVNNEPKGAFPQKHHGNNDDCKMLREVVGDNLGDIPRLISLTPNECLLLPHLMPSAPSIDSIGSPCEKMLRKSLTLLSGEDVTDEQNTDLQITAQDPFGRVIQEVKESNTGLDVTRSTCEGMRNKVERVEKERAARLHDFIRQTPSIDHLAHYIIALSSALSPNPSGDLPSRALSCLFSLSEHSSDKQQRIDMVRSDAAASTDIYCDKNDTTLIPALLAFVRRCPRNSYIQQLTLLVLNNLSIPSENRRLIALEYGGTKILGRLLKKDPGCQMLVLIMVNLTFGDEQYPLIDPDDPITRRVLNRVVCFVDLWKKRGLPLDFRHFVGVNTGLCSM